MNRKTNFRLALLAVFIGAVFACGGNALMQSRQRIGDDRQGEVVREAFEQSYPLAANGRVSLKNINGSVEVKAWDRNEVRVEAVKWAYRAERLAELKVDIDASASAVRIKTQYLQTNRDGYNDRERRYDNPASVEFVLTVPRTARIDKVELINGDLDLEGLTGEIQASSINGEVTAKELTGDIHLSTINGRLEFNFERGDSNSPLRLSSVNGSVELVLASDSEAELKARTVHGSISNELGLPVKKGKYVGRNLAGLLGRGGSEIDLSNVNGSIRIRRANDGRQPSLVTNTLTSTRDDDR